ncbi:uncharacterized protein EI90DRAFT_3019034 [Cantharellus anzutake]|uniref:uncharacterized protein n=1 Tax=Cantharellus anzutake TaxID=1750568 RepID=UPI00190362E7|nr:uncharacterized protein EI90DRAFT_3019034 [Cantharellus anzutake]KAF8325584.1 hypothetical protein EI90DRAFT_3019034 [Cantharellus anzutake]
MKTGVSKCDSNKLVEEQAANPMGREIVITLMSITSNSTPGPNDPIGSGCGGAGLALNSQQKSMDADYELALNKGEIPSQLAASYSTPLGHPRGHAINKPLIAGIFWCRFRQQ